jgi:hypothetical protein
MEETVENFDGLSRYLVLSSFIMNIPYHGMEGSRTNLDKNNVIHLDPS